MFRHCRLAFVAAGTLFGDGMHLYRGCVVLLSWIWLILGGERSVYCKVRNMFRFSFFNCVSSFSFDLCILAVNGNAVRVAFGRNRPETLHKPINEHTSDLVVGICKSGIASVV